MKKLTLYISAFIILSYFEVIFGSEFIETRPPQVFWKWSNVGQPISNQRGRSSVIMSSTPRKALEVVEPFQDAGSNWWSLFDLDHLNRNSLSQGSYQRDSPISWSTNPNNQVEEERLVMGRRTKLSQGPRRRKRSEEMFVTSIDQQFGIPIVVSKTEDIEQQNSLHNNEAENVVNNTGISFRNDEVFENVIPPPAIKKTKQSRFRSEELKDDLAPTDENNIQIVNLNKSNSSSTNQTWRPYSLNYIGDQLQRRCFFEGLKLI
jgi:hypothetical protein